ncbi:MAG TPA: lytic transglycosylase F [Acidobacteria bacterium]|nr:lytic transglycosylase F [Acidobacteriota bacterium]
MLRGVDDRRGRLRGLTTLTIALLLVVTSCHRSSGERVASAKTEPAPPPIQLLATAKVVAPWKGDLDAMAQRRTIRCAVTLTRTSYFLDGTRQRGATYELLRGLQKFINRERHTKTLQINVIAVPTARNQLLPSLREGRVDIAAANLTITPEREKLVDFTEPFYDNAREIVVTGPGAPELPDLAALGGRRVMVRRSSSYWTDLERLNQRLKAEGKPAVKLVAMPEVLETEDILELTNAGAVTITVADDYLADLWAKVFPNITLHPDLALRDHGRIAWAIRKDSPQLKAMLDRFVRSHRAGTLTGNVLIKRYFKNTRWISNPIDTTSEAKLERLRPIFDRYAKEYGFDPLMVMALAYQESGLDQSKRSHVGAVGIMQLLPTTAADPNVGIPDITTVEANIHAGTKYLRFLRDRYFSDPAIDPLNAELFTFAAYNAGPARIAKLRAEAARMGLDPNRWFDNVEVVAAKRIGRETVRYVANIVRYSVAFDLGHAQVALKNRALGRDLKDRSS